ncbi:Wzt carbohydrate-binding domain-containing protein, partial [Pseudomonas viridiflava]
VESGEEIVFNLALRFNRMIVNPIIGFTIKTKEGVTVYGTNSYMQDCEVVSSLGSPGTDAKACLRFRNALATGDYFISVGIASRQGEEVIPHDRRYDSIHFIVEPTPKLLGLIDLGASMEIESVHANA